MPIVASDSLHALTRAVCAAGGSTLEEATLVADQLVEANLTGHDSHGVGLLPVYVRCLQEGSLVANRHVDVVVDRGAVLVLEGQRGYGQVIGHEAMQLAMARAADEGVALVAIRNSFHLGRIGHWAEQCARGGFASIHFVNGIDHPPLQAPYGAAEARVSTNPFSAALPGPDGPVVLLDMATSKIAVGKARVAANRGVPVPEGMLLDPAGRPTRDGNVMFASPKGAILSMGEHKGSGLAILCEMLAGALTGGWTAQPEHPQAGGIINNMLSVVIDPDALGGRQQVSDEAALMVAYIKSAKVREGFDEVLVPGEPERRRRAERLAAGVDVDERTWAEILAAARDVGVSDGEIDAIL
jgi:uncharacterized oxidoreductase